MSLLSIYPKHIIDAAIDALRTSDGHIQRAANALYGRYGINDDRSVYQWLGIDECVFICRAVASDIAIQGE